MKRNELKKIKLKIETIELIPRQKKLFIKLYKEGISLFELTHLFKIDFLSAIDIIKRAKIKKISLYKIYEKQQERKELLNIKKQLTNREKNEIEKYFPESNTDITFSYFLYWSDQFKKKQIKQKKCKHVIRNITCAYCGKILNDASNMPLELSIS